MLMYSDKWTVYKLRCESNILLLDDCRYDTALKLHNAEAVIYWHHMN